jgi:uncharacterized protein (TIGR00369 family)
MGTRSTETDGLDGVWTSIATDPLARPAGVPFFDTIDLRILALRDNGAQCDMLYGAWLSDLAELGIPAGYAAVADSALSYACNRTVAVGKIAISMSLHLDYLRVPPRSNTRVTASAGVSVVDPSYAIAHGQIVDDAGSAIASISLRALAIPQEDLAFRAQVPTSLTPAHPVPANAAPDSSRTSAEQVPVTGDLAKLLGSRSAELFSLAVVSIAPGEVELSFVASVDVARTGGVVHGGAVALLCQLTSAFALHSTLPEGVVPRRLDLHVDYVRPTPTMRPARARARISLRTRRSAVMICELLDERGRITASSRETVLLVAPART